MARSLSTLGFFGLVWDRYSIYCWTPLEPDSLHYYCDIVTRPGPPLYPRGVSRPSSPEHSPTLGLLLGLLITLAAVVAYSAYITWQMAGLRKLQSELIDRNRKDSLAVAAHPERPEPAGRRHARHGQTMTNLIR